MKTKKSNENYTGVCHYCGAIFRTQKSTRTFCPDTTHRQMNAKRGSIINPLFEDEDGNILNADHLLRTIYEGHGGINSDKWSSAVTASHFREYFAYTGPLPQGTEILVVRSFLIQRSISISCLEPRYKVKPIHLLYPWEGATQQFTSVDHLVSNKQHRAGIDN